MAYQVVISHGDLIDALEEKLGNVYENIDEGDYIFEIELRRHEVIITIGKEV